MISKQSLEGYVAFKVFVNTNPGEAPYNPYPPMTLENRNWEFGWDTGVREHSTRIAHSKGDPEAPEISGNCGC